MNYHKNIIDKINDNYIGHFIYIDVWYVYDM